MGLVGLAFFAKPSFTFQLCLNKWESHITLFYLTDPLRQLFIHNFLLLTFLMVLLMSVIMEKSFFIKRHLTFILAMQSKTLPLYLDLVLLLAFWMILIMS